MKTILIAATTLNNKIAKHAGHNVDWTSKKDKEFFRSEVKKAGAAIFGSTTYETMGKTMPGVLNVIMTRDPSKYASKVKSGSVEFTSASAQEILAQLAGKGYNQVVLGGGSLIYSLFLEQGLVNEIYLTIAPKIFGSGVNLFKEMKIDELDLELLEVSKLGTGEILLKYKV